MEKLINTYWFRRWMKSHRVTNGATLERTLSSIKGIDSLLEAAPKPVIRSGRPPSEQTELTAGKGIDLTGELGCRHIDCLGKEVDGLFRHAWHYFDRIILPDQALFCVMEFKNHKDPGLLANTLTSFVEVLRLLDKDKGYQLVRFEIRAPSCRQHFQEHAREGQIDQAFTNTVALRYRFAAEACSQFVP